LTDRSPDRTPLADMVRATDPRLVLVALPASYLRLVSDDLAAIDAETWQRLRIFTSKAGLKTVPGELTPCVLPYDERLESIPGFDGTRADFPQRALRHFVLELRGHSLTLSDAHSQVDRALAELKPRAIPVRARRTDQQITDLIRTHWPSCGGNSARLLRQLRDQELVACEQSRFRDLWRLVKAQQDAETEGRRATI
jgi:hypothetical protein